MGRRMKVAIRQLAEDEIDLLDNAIKRDPLTHYERYRAQKAGSLVYLIAWLDGLPVGFVMVRWRGKLSPAFERRFPRCPHLLDLYVVPAYRNCNVGTQLMEAAEQVARQRGCTHMGLSVALANHRARALYKRRGYQDAGFATYWIAWTEIDEHGKPHTIEEECMYVVRTLD